MAMSVQNARTDANLKHVHPKLVAVVRRALEILEPEDGLSFVVTEGLRSPERQNELLAKGASQTRNSKHLAQADGFSHAVDLAATVDGKVRWDWPLYQRLAEVMRQAAKEQETGIFWGGDWPKLRDGPHFQLT